jgi:transposase
LAVRGERGPARLLFRLHPKVNLNGPRIRAFLDQLRRQVRGPVVLLWDRVAGHLSGSARGFAAQNPRFHFVFLPPYAPELNPFEGIWNWLKRNPLANYASVDAAVLNRRAYGHARTLQRRPKLLRAFQDRSPLFSRPKLDFTYAGINKAPGCDHVIFLNHYGLMG